MSSRRAIGRFAHVALGNQEQGDDRHVRHQGLMQTKRRQCGGRRGAQCLTHQPGRGDQSAGGGDPYVKSCKRSELRRSTPPYFMQFNLAG